MAFDIVQTPDHPLKRGHSAASSAFASIGIAPTPKPALSESSPPITRTLITKSDATAQPPLSRSERVRRRRVAIRAGAPRAPADPPQAPDPDSNQFHPPPATPHSEAYAQARPRAKWARPVSVILGCDALRRWQERSVQGSDHHRATARRPGCSLGQSLAVITTTSQSACKCYTYDNTRAISITTVPQYPGLPGTSRNAFIQPRAPIAQSGGGANWLTQLNSMYALNREHAFQMAHDINWHLKSRSIVPETTPPKRQLPAAIFRIPASELLSKRRVLRKLNGKFNLVHVMGMVRTFRIKGDPDPGLSVG
ncbi:hypothetical protein B0H17DRAFT_1177929 [Mycena rosella]|uniref:Uncharacterized protein n=1 Tax=Mycena rosella TaxID=1033263 RepID=A0AAD7DPB2_MYCRO|nr:hypothetical protein B0H17DRAFT_1177929 [Mycena rosella]